MHSIRVTAATIACGGLLLIGAALAIATSAAAAPATATARSTAPASSAPASTVPSSSAAGSTAQPTVGSTRPPVAAPTAAPGRIEVPAGNAGVRPADDATSITAVALVGAGMLLAGGGVVVAVRRPA